MDESSNMPVCLLHWLVGIEGMAVSSASELMPSQRRLQLCRRLLKPAMNAFSNMFVCLLHWLVGIERMLESSASWLLTQ